MEIIRSYDRLISTTGFPILVRRHLYIESGPWAHLQCQATNQMAVVYWYQFEVAMCPAVADLLFSTEWLLRKPLVDTHYRTTQLDRASQLHTIWHTYIKTIFAGIGHPIIKIRKSSLHNPAGQSKATIGDTLIKIVFPCIGILFIKMSSNKRPSLCIGSHIIKIKIQSKDHFFQV